MSRFQLPAQNPEMQKTVELNYDYWDCDCPTDYIHPVGDYGCEKCGALVIHSPASRASEVTEYKLDLISGVKQ